MMRLGGAKATHVVTNSVRTWSVLLLSLCWSLTATRSAGLLGIGGKLPRTRAADLVFNNVRGSGRGIASVPSPVLPLLTAGIRTAYQSSLSAGILTKMVFARPA